MAAASKSTQKGRGDNLTLLNYKVDELQKGFERIETKLDNNAFATKGDLADVEIKVEKIEARITNYPLVEKIVFGLVGIILLAVASAVVYLVVDKGGA